MRYTQDFTCGREARKYRESTTTISTENAPFSNVWPSATRSPNRAAPSEVIPSTCWFTASRIWNWRSSCWNHGVPMTSATVAGRPVTSWVDCSTTVGTSRATIAPATAARPSAAARTPAHRGAPQRSMRRTTGSRPRAMNRAAAIHTSSWPLVCSTHTTLSASITPVASRNPVATGARTVTTGVSSAGGGAVGSSAGSAGSHVVSRRRASPPQRSRRPRRADRPVGRVPGRDGAGPSIDTGAGGTCVVAGAGAAGSGRGAAVDPGARAAVSSDGTAEREAGLVGR